MVMNHGDFTDLAKDYLNRAGYAHQVIKKIAKRIGASNDDFTVADVGAGTGKLTQDLRVLSFSGFAIEPNDAMRKVGMELFFKERSFIWSKGSAEQTHLADDSVNWVLMASSFHWTDPGLALKEFYRILKKGGHFTALWNPRDIKENPLHQQIEKRIYNILPDLKRISSGSRKHLHDIEETLLSTRYFHDLFFMEARHEVPMSKQRYMGAWRSVNDIQVQAGEKKFKAVLCAIEEEIEGLETIIVPYKTRAWTVQCRK